MILLSEADEEGGSYGTRWLADNHWAKIDAGVSLNEGGWIFKDAARQPRLLGITTIDKNSLSVTVRTRGNEHPQLAAAARQRDPPARARA